jgi:hypothetical protein
MLGPLILLLLMQQVSNVPTANSASGVVEGVVRAGGKPAAGVRVGATVPPDSTSDPFFAAALASIAETDAEGRYRLENIPPGRYYISAGRVDLPTYYPGTPSVREATIVSVAAGATRSNVDFALDVVSVGRAAVSFLGASGPVGLTLSVSIQVEDGGKVPVFGEGHFPVLKLTRVGTTLPVEMWFSAMAVTVPLPLGTIPDEYKVTVEDLPDGYAVKAITHGSTDILKENLKLSRQGLAIQPARPAITALVPAAGIASSGIPISLTLTRAPRPASPGVRVLGRTAGVGGEVYLSGKPGFLYQDGTFEFSGVPPGLHTILRYGGNSVTAAPVLVRDRDIEGIALQPVSILPTDVFSDVGKPVEGNAPASVGWLSFIGRVLDGASQETLDHGTVTVAGYGGIRQTFAIVAGEGFRIPRLLPGTYTITINVTDYASTPHTVVVGLEDLKLDLKATKEQ